MDFVRWLRPDFGMSEPQHQTRLDGLGGLRVAGPVVGCIDDPGVRRLAERVPLITYGTDPDARWRVDQESVGRLAVLQRQLLDAAVRLVRPGGEVTYSVCTVTAAETADVARTVDLNPLPVGEPWRPYEGGGRLLPQDCDTDGMVVFRWRR